MQQLSAASARPAGPPALLYNKCVAAVQSNASLPHSVNTHET